MDQASIIVTALGTAFAAGGQAVLNDTAKELFERLKKRILGAFSGQQKELIILDEYEHAPDTWEKPLKDALIKTGLAQDEVAVTMAQRLVELLSPQANMRDHIEIQHNGPGHGAVYGNNYGPIHVNVGEDKISAGNTALLRGKNALWRMEYENAKRDLAEASRLLPEQQLPAQAAQIRFLQVLALLNNKRPFSARYQVFNQIEQLLRGAIALHPSRSYLYTLALILRDYSRNGFSHLLAEAQELIDQMQQTPLSSGDQENSELLSHCQPHLFHDSQDIHRLFMYA